MPKVPEWYEIVDAHEPLAQGDFLDGCPQFVPDYGAVPRDLRDLDRAQAQQRLIPTRVRIYDVVILSHSCDLVDGGIDNVEVCPHYTLEEMLASGMKKDHFHHVQKGHMPAYHMLEACTLGAKKRQGNCTFNQPVS